MAPAKKNGRLGEKCHWLRFPGILSVVKGAELKSGVLSVVKGSECQYLSDRFFFKRHIKNIFLCISKHIRR